MLRLRDNHHPSWRFLDIPRYWTRGCIQEVRRLDDGTIRDGIVVFLRCSAAFRRRVALFFAIFRKQPFFVDDEPVLRDDMEGFDDKNEFMER